MSRERSSIENEPSASIGKDAGTWLPMKQGVV